MDIYVSFRWVIPPEDLVHGHTAASWSRRRSAPSAKGDGRGGRWASTLCASAPARSAKSSCSSRSTPRWSSRRGPRTPSRRTTRASTELSRETPTSSSSCGRHEGPSRPGTSLTEDSWDRPAQRIAVPTGRSGSRDPRSCSPGESQRIRYAFLKIFFRF